MLCILDLDATCKEVLRASHKLKHSKVLWCLFSNLLPKVSWVLIYPLCYTLNFLYYLYWKYSLLSHHESIFLHLYLTYVACGYLDAVPFCLLPSSFSFFSNQMLKICVFLIWYNVYLNCLRIVWDNRYVQFCSVNILGPVCPFISLFLVAGQEK